MKNAFRIDGATTYLQCRRKKTRTVVEVAFDTEDFALVASYPGTWYFSAGNYCRMSVGRKSVFLHVVVAGRVNAQDHMITDHLDSQQSNCRKSNLCVISQKANSAKMRLGHQARGASGVRNVIVTNNGFVVYVRGQYVGTYANMETAEASATNMRNAINFSRLTTHLGVG